jgi:hypothetical protein
MKKYIVLITIFISMLWNFNSGICRSWDDLDEGEHEIYGSEKEEKFPVKALFWEMEKWENHYSNMLFWIYKHTDYPKYKSTRFLPFYYGLDSKIDNRTMSVWPLFLTWYETDGNIEDTTVVFPIYGSTIDTKNNNYDRRFLLFWWGRDYSYPPRVKHYQTLFPLSYHSSDVNEKTGDGEYLWINPIFVSWRGIGSDKDEKEHLWWVPIIPFITFNYVDRNEGHRNFFLLIDYSWDIVKGEDSMRRFWFMPFVFWKKGDNGYTSVLPPVYINNKYSNGDFYFQFLPFYVSWRDTYWKDSKTSEVTNQKLTILFGKRSVVDEKTGEELYSNFWFPIIPIFFRSNDKDTGTHTNILGIFDWQSSKDGSLKHWDIIPFITHGSGNTEKEGYSWGIFHYHSWSESRNTWWAWLYYSSEEYVNKPVAKGSKEPPEKEEFYYTHFIPLYLSWKSQESTGRLFIPFVFTYQDRQTDIHVNLSGYASKSYMGPFSPQVAAGLEKKDETWYLDTDVSWMYDVVSVSARIPMKNPFAAKNDGAESVKSKPDKAAATVEEKKTTGIVAKKEMNRDNSEYFWGWKLLFGWMAYERADSKRHFRLIPLSWLTWDENADDKLYVWPLFVWYKSEADKEEYFVTPVYAAQYQDKSYAKAYGIILYWDEYEAEKDYHEKSVVWPFINWYSSPEKYGFRVFPLFWYKGWKEGSDDVTQTFSPLHYSKSIQDGAGEYKYRKRINPFCYLREENSEKNPSYSLFVPLIPLFYHGTESDQVTTSSSTITPLFYYNSEDINENNVHVNSTFWAPLLPLYYSYSSNDYSHWNLLGIMDRMKSKDYSRFFLLPLYYGSNENAGGTVSDTDLTLLFYYNTEDSTKTGVPAQSSTFWAPIIPLYYNHSEGEYSHWNLLGLLDSCSDKDYSRFFFLPFYYSTQEKDKSHRNILGIIDLWKNEKGYETTMVFPFWWWSGDDKSDSLVLFPLLSYFNTEPGEKTKFIAGLYLHESKDYERQNFLYLFSHKKFSGGYYPRDEYSMLLTTMELDLSKDYMEMRALWGLLFKYKNYRNSPNYDADAFLWLAGMERSGDYFHHRILPLYWYSSDKSGTILTVPVALSYFSEDTNGSFDLGVLGLLYFRNENRAAGEDRRMWLLGTLYNEVKVPERKYHARGSFWGLLWDYETEEETGFTKFTILKGLYKYRDRNGESDHTFFWFL